MTGTRSTLVSIIDSILSDRDGITVEDGWGVPMVVIHLPDDTAVCLSYGHNRDGWEACRDTGGDQYPLPDGPAASACDGVVAQWAATLVNVLIDHPTLYL